MNSIKNVPARVLSRRPGHSLEAEREQFDKTQASGGAAGGREAPSPRRRTRLPAGPGRGLGAGDGGAAVAGWDQGVSGARCARPPRCEPPRAQVNRKRAPAPGPWWRGRVAERRPGTEVAGEHGGRARDAAGD